MLYGVIASPVWFCVDFPPASHGSGSTYFQSGKKICKREKQNLCFSVAVYICAASYPPVLESVQQGLVAEEGRDDHG